MRVDLLSYTRDAKELLIFSKRTRHMSDASAMGAVFDMSEAEKDQELDYVFSTIGSSWEFVDYIFLITGVTRAFTHQLVRHRVGVSFAQQAQRVADMSEFEYLKTGSVAGDPVLSIMFDSAMDEIKSRYKNMMALGANPQDARGVLPTNILTNIMMKVNLRALSTITEVRLCVRAQGEFQRVAMAMAGEVNKVHPWASRILGPKCLVSGVCAFPRYDECPVRKAVPALAGLTQEEFKEALMTWEGLVGYYDPQPDPSKASRK